MATNANQNNSSPNPMPDSQPTLTQTKTRTKTVVLALVGAAILGTLVWAGAVVRGRARTICNSGPNAGQECTSTADCKRPEARNARCVKAGTLPDLRIQSISLNPMTPNVGQAVEVNFVVENAGANLPVSGTLAFHHRLRIDLNNDGTWDIVPEISLPIGPGGGDPMPAGATASRGWTNTTTSGVDTPIWTATAGTHLVEVCTDTFTASAFTNLVVESNENNNCLTQSVTVAPPVIPLADLHNLFERIPDTPTEGAPFALRVRVQNIGVADAGPSTSGLQFDLGNNGMIDETLPTRAVSAIVAGATAEAVEWSWSAWPSGGPHRLVLCADSESTVTESDEGNNCTTIVLVSSAPVSVSPVFYLSPMSPSGGTVPGNNEVLIFTVSAIGVDTGLTSFAFDIDSRDNRSTGWNTWRSSTDTFGMSPSSFQLYAGSSIGSARASSPISGIWLLRGDRGQTLSTDADTSTIVNPAEIVFPSTIGILAGTSKTFILKADSAGASPGDTLQARMSVDINAPFAGLPLTGGTLRF